MMQREDFAGANSQKEQKELIRQKALGHKRNLGHVTSEETKRKISEALKGRVLKEETKEKLRNHPKIKGNTNRRKTVYQIDNTGILVAVYSNTYEAQLKTGIRRNNISSCCRGRLKHAGGFKWTYNYGTNTN